MRVPAKDRSNVLKLHLSGSSCNSAELWDIMGAFESRICTKLAQEQPVLCATMHAGNCKRKTR
jgi:hypothetical protein